MSDTIELGDLSIRPSFEKALKPVHPAIGMIDDTAYVGVWIPCQLESIDKQGNSKILEKDLLFMVTDKHEKILANDEVLSERGWRIAYKPIRFEDRWPLEDVKGYLVEHSNSIDPIQVLEHILEQWKTYMELPSPEEYVYEALWTIGTYFHHLFNAYPYRYVGGVKRTGKSKDLTLHNCLAFNAVFSNNMSTSSIYRLIQNAKSTLLIDETEKLKNPDRAQDFRSILLAGYKRGEKVYRVEKNRKEQLVPESFEVYSPKALANISGIEDVLEDRCKVSFLRRSINRAVADREIDINDRRWPQLRCELYRLYLDHWCEVQSNYRKLCELSETHKLLDLLGAYTADANEELRLLTARELELWKPIFALAMFFERRSPSSSLFKSMVTLAIEDTRQKQIENLTETGEALLVQALLEIVKSEDWYPVKDMKIAITGKLDEEAKWLTSEWLGRALRRLGFREKRRLGTGVQYKLAPEQIESLALRFGIVKEVKDMHEVNPLEQDHKGQNTSLEKRGHFSSEDSRQTLPTQPALEVTGKLHCEGCGSFEAKMHLIPNRGIKWLCDHCLRDYPGEV